MTSNHLVVNVHNAYSGESVTSSINLQPCCVSISHMTEVDVYAACAAASAQSIWHISRLIHCLNGVQTLPFHTVQLVCM